MPSWAEKHLDDPIHAGELHNDVRAASRLSYATRAAWIDTLFDQPNHLQMDDWLELERTCSLPESDAILICAGDIADLKALIERVKGSAPHAAILSVHEKITPSELALVLNWGCDDVLNVGMFASEGAARVRAACRRISQTRVRGSHPSGSALSTK
jgi:hypothetical protein